MAAHEVCTSYKGYYIYHPEESDISKDRNGQYWVTMVLEKDGRTQIQRIPIAYALGGKLAEALAGAMDDAMRLIDDGLVPILVGDPA